MRSIWVENLKKFVDGTTIGGASCLKVSVENTSPLPIATSSFVYFEKRFHLPASTTINRRSGAWVQLDVNSDAAAGTPANIANTIKEMRINWNGGAALEIGVGATAGVVSTIANAGAGQTTAIGVALSSGNKVWARALQDVDIVSGELLVQFLG